jgi:2-polyprenyl-3-methyl-5-hydroxy-6-metoxy-1,4-benzoquinol methylase
MVVDLGANDGVLSEKISAKVKGVVAVDIKKPADFSGIKTMELDLNGSFDKELGSEVFDKVVALDIIEHLYNPEEAMLKINRILKDGGSLYISTANIAFLLMRFTLLLGWFNYGKRGILDKTHHRLYTIKSFKRLLKNSGFTIEKVVGFGPPIADEISNKGLFLAIDRVAGYFARLRPSLFSFNYLAVAKKNIPLHKTYKLTVKK